MTENRISIESCYGEPGEESWAYNAKEKSSGRVVLEAGIEKTGEASYHLILRTNDGEEEKEHVYANDLWEVDGKLIEIIRLKACELLGNE